MHQINKIQSELEREQKSRLSAQSELRDQFLECRAHHAVSSQPKPTPTEIPDFLKKVIIVTPSWSLHVHLIQFYSW